MATPFRAPEHAHTYETDVEREVGDDDTCDDE
jgi:hypothetical protein